MLQLVSFPVIVQQVDSSPYTVLKKKESQEGYEILGTTSRSALKLFM
uniref:Uncharacterized protein n=1 Tax=Anguilla anguilla TaxID=7936 RepID=A0A0E9W4M1_ANGAN